MRSNAVALALAVVVVVAATAFLTGAEVPEEDVTPASGGAATSFDATVESFDGTEIALTVYRPAGATAAQPVPVVLHSHGWSGSRTTDGGGIVGRLWDAGFGVVSIDARGHGDSGGEAMIHHKDFEVKDFQAVLDWIHDDLDWVMKEPSSGVPKDVVAGGAGYSYGGAFQLMTASYDRRLDALAPEITWGDLPHALAPAGVVKSAWVDFLYLSAKESGTRIDPRIDEWYQRAVLLNELPEAAIEHLRGSSPVHENIEADVLLIQGVPDVLFNLDQALLNYRELEAHQAGDVRLFTHLTGHVAPYLQPVGTSVERRELFQDEGPCGTTSDVVLAWLDEKLRAGPPSGIPEVSFALDDGECLELDALPTQLVEVEARAGVAPSAAGSAVVPLMQGPAVIAGAPHLTARASGSGATAFASLVVVSPGGYTRVVDDQTAPLRILPNTTLSADLTAVAARLDPGDQLLLRLDGLNEWYVHNGARTPGATVLTDIVVTLPLVDG